MDNQNTFNTKLSTDEILKEIESGNTVDTDAIPFVERQEQLILLSRKIKEHYTSFDQCAHASIISPPHLNEFLNNKTQMSRDKLLCLCITLKCSIGETRQILRRLGSTDLYSKNRRDFEILNCIQQGKTLDETNEILEKNGLDILSGKRQQS